ncbi:hypothetical protein KEM60_02899 [Austwickia sp. TVS 96-490-7B]|uniref:GNAT family N-acetyltransferase n=1 Tax=Austwickia sp. TVS 96-490-7B TaxID=2830843 RepID=UPI001D9D6417|nr:hypothetical protein [Austwickia sp. TVS 96-490-7B]
MAVLASIPIDGGRELGYTLATRTWGRELMTELAQALSSGIGACVTIPPSCLTAFAVADNAASLRMLEKVSFCVLEIREYK